MDPNRLCRDELLYELKVRGFAHGSETVVTMRRKLRNLLSKESFGDLVTADSLKAEFDVNVEYEVCSKKVSELIDFANKFKGGSETNEAKSIDTKLHHLYGRLQRLISFLSDEDDDKLNEINRFIGQLEDIEVVLDSKNFNLTDQTVSVTKVTDVANSTAINTVNSVTSSNKIVPVHKWGIVFSGDNKGLSVNAFIERVEEYRVARNVSEIDLQNSIIDVLQGSALIWYRSIKAEVSSWNDFVKRLREEYLPFDYETELWNEIRNRIQGPKERVGNYFACMKNLFARLPQLPSEQQKLAVLRRNILPYYINGVGLQIYDSVDELLRLCKALETAKELASANRLPAINRLSVLEPDLAYHGNERSSIISSCSGGTNNTAEDMLTANSDDKCWNCLGSGHRFRQCRQPRKKRFCYRCGQSDVTKFSCKRCKGNGVTGRLNAGRRP